MSTTGLVNSLPFQRGVVRVFIVGLAAAAAAPDEEAVSGTPPDPGGGSNDVPGRLFVPAMKMVPEFESTGCLPPIGGDPDTTPVDCCSPPIVLE